MTEIRFEARLCNYSIFPQYDFASKRKLCTSQNMLNVKLVILVLPLVISQRDFYFRSVEDRCISTCVFKENFLNWTFQCDGDNSTCDWQCAGQRMGCAEGKVYHCAQDFYNFEMNNGKIEYIEACATERFCNAGEEPFVTFSFDDEERSLRNAKINCVPCTDPHFYNSQAGKSSASYSRCHMEKFNKCIPEDYKINCGDISWHKRKETDGYCRCDARNGYAPENENVKTKCFYSDELCIEKTCPPAQELLLNYTCGVRCPSGMHRAEGSDECVPDKLVQTTKNPSTILTSQPRSEKTKSHVNISPTTETIKVFITKREENGTSDSADPRVPMVIAVGTFFVLVFLFVVICVCRITKCTVSAVHITLCSKSKTIHKNITKIAGDQVRIRGDNPNVRFGSQTRQTEQPILSDDSSEGIECPSFTQVHDPTDILSQRSEETSFTISPDQTLPSNDRDKENQGDSERPLLSGYKEMRPLDMSDNITTAIIEERVENAFMNTDTFPSQSGIAVTDEGSKLCPCDKPAVLCDDNLQQIAQKCEGHVSFRADLELSPDIDLEEALKIWRKNITSETRYENYMKLVDAVGATGEGNFHSQLLAKLLKDETAYQRPVIEDKILAKTLSSKNNPLPPNSVPQTHGTTPCLNGDDKTMEDTRTHDQETHCQNNEVDDTKKTSHTNENGQVSFCTQGTYTEIVNELRTIPIREQARRKHINSVDELSQASERETDTEASESENVL